MFAMKFLILRSKRVLEARDHAFDDITLFVDGGIAVGLHFAVVRDDGRGPARGERGAQIIAVIALVADQFGRRRRLESNETALSRFPKHCAINLVKLKLECNIARYDTP